MTSYNVKLVENDNILRQACCSRRQRQRKRYKVLSTTLYAKKTTWFLVCRTVLPTKLYKIFYMAEPWIQLTIWLLNGKNYLDIASKLDHHLFVDVISFKVTKIKTICTIHKKSNQEQLRQTVVSNFHKPQDTNLNRNILDA